MSGNRVDIRLISYVKNPVNSYVSNDTRYFTVDNAGILRTASKGLGILYSQIRRSSGEMATVGINCQFLMRQMMQTGCSIDDSGRLSVEQSVESILSCSGFIMSTGEGYVIGPAFRLEPVKGEAIILMLFAPRNKPFNVSVEKNVLTIPNDDSEVTVNPGAGEIRCTGTISSQAKEAHLVLNRNPRFPVYQKGFNETLTTIKGGGWIGATWKPVARSFDDLLVAFYSKKLLSDDVYTWGLDRIVNKLGAPDLAETEPTDYIVADGSGIDYTLRLTVDHGLGRHQSDETTVTVT